MATNIEMNLLKDNGSYEVLYPKTDYNGLINKPSIPDVSNFVTSPVAIYEGGTGGTSASTGIYNLINGTTNNPDALDNFSSVYFPFIYNSTGYKCNEYALRSSLLKFYTKQREFSISTSWTKIGITECACAIINATRRFHLATDSSGTNEIVFYTETLLVQSVDNNNSTYYYYDGTDIKSFNFTSVYAKTESSSGTLSLICMGTGSSLIF